jgi:hypothetical protein
VVVEEFSNGEEKIGSELGHIQEQIEAALESLQEKLKKGEDLKTSEDRLYNWYDTQLPLLRGENGMGNEGKLSFYKLKEVLYGYVTSDDFITA